MQTSVVPYFKKAKAIPATQADFVDSIYSGDLTGDLAASRNARKLALTNLVTNARQQDQSLLDSTVSGLGTARAGYKTSMDDLIGAHVSELAAGRTGYGAQIRAALAKSQADQDAELNDIIHAEDLGVTQSIAEGDRANKAMFAMTGAGPSSYAIRLGTGLRLKANADRAQRIAAIKRANRQANEERQLALDSNLSDRERADLNSVYGDRSNFLNTVSGQERSDLGFGFSGQSSVNDREAARLLGLETDFANQDREDERFVLGQQQNYLGTLPKAPKANKGYAAFF